MDSAEALGGLIEVVSSNSSSDSESNSIPLKAADLVFRLSCEGWDEEPSSDPRYEYVCPETGGEVGVLGKPGVTGDIVGDRDTSDSLARVSLPSFGNIGSPNIIFRNCGAEAGGRSDAELGP